MTEYANRGRELEAAVISSCAIYRARKLAVIQKVATPVRFPRDAEPFREKSTVDFVGRYLRWPVAFDCKQVRGERWQPGKSHKHQQAFLEDFGRQGGIAFYLIDFVDRDTFAIPPDALVQAMGERKSLCYKAARRSEFTGWSCFVRRGEHGVPLHFGAAIEWLAGRSE